MAKKIEIDKYVHEIKRNFKTQVQEEIIHKDFLLTLILSEFQKRGLGNNLIFKGGTLLSRNFLEYHRFSEDLDFVHKDSNKLRAMNRSAREKTIKKFIDEFCPILESISKELNLDFNADRSNTRYCKIMHPRLVYTFNLYYSEKGYIKVEINFIEKILLETPTVSVRTITDFFDSKELLFELGLSYENFKVKSYSVQEIILEKYRAILTRKTFQERDIFDLFFIGNSLNPDISLIIDKINNSAVMRKNVKERIAEKLDLLKNNSFFKSNENMEHLSIREYNEEKFQKFKEKIKPILIKICENLLK
jgi:predicted nucleotidyltransferase component of viral defense system